jgi:hypothetical protein
MNKIIKNKIKNNWPNDFKKGDLLITLALNGQTIFIILDVSETVMAGYEVSLTGTKQNKFQTYSNFEIAMRFMRI